MGIGTIQWMAFGRLDEAVRSYTNGVSLDPGAPLPPAVLGIVYLGLGDDTRAEQWIDRSMKLGPGSLWSSGAMLMLESYRGEEARVREHATTVAKIDPGWRAGTALTHLLSHELRAGRFVEARARYAALYPELDHVDPRVDTMNYRQAIDLASILSRTGERERADVLLERSLVVIQSMARLGYFGFWVSDVQVYALQGETERALDALREAIDEGWRTDWWFFLRLDASLESLHGEARFQAMIGELEAEMATQLARVLGGFGAGGNLITFLGSTLHRARSVPAKVDSNRDKL